MQGAVITLTLAPAPWKPCIHCPPLKAIRRVRLATDAEPGQCHGMLSPLSQGGGLPEASDLLVTRGGRVLVTAGHAVHEAADPNPNPNPNRRTRRARGRLCC